MKNRTIFIGDIHGCYDEFQLILKTLNIQKKDTVYILGDMINKGPKSFEVLDYIYNQKNFFPVLGNHELNFLFYLNGSRYPFSEHSRYTWDKLYKKLLKRPKILKWLKKIPNYIETEEFIVLHGGKSPVKTLKNHSQEEITNLRTLKNGKAWYNTYRGPKKIIYGHWAVEGVNIRDNTIGLDSGCVYGNHLSAYILESYELIQQKALKQYVNPETNKVNNTIIEKISKFIYKISGK